MKVVKDPATMQAIAEAYRLEGKRIGFVPTMGYLHDGHLSLVKQAKLENDVVFVSIFVNPTQFAPNEDLDRYPRDFERDRNLLEAESVDVLFYPDEKMMYPEGYQTYVTVERITRVLEGKSRPTHFRGVATIVTKLFNITKPHRAYFGKKDAQQLLVVKRLVMDLNMDVEIVGMPIVREADGLAMSSRNRYLTDEERRDAVCLYRALEEAKRMIEAGETRSAVIIDRMKRIIDGYKSARIDYISINSLKDLSPLENIQKGETLISLAVFIGTTRLIDNMWF